MAGRYISTKQAKIRASKRTSVNVSVKGDSQVGRLLTSRMRSAVYRFHPLLIAVSALFCVVSCRSGFDRNGWLPKFVVDSRFPADLSCAQAINSLLIVQWQEFGSFIVYVGAAATLTNSPAGRDVEIKLYGSVPKHGDADETVWSYSAHGNGPACAHLNGSTKKLSIYWGISLES